MGRLSFFFFFSLGNCEEAAAACYCDCVVKDCARLASLDVCYLKGVG